MAAETSSSSWVIIPPHSTTRFPSASKVSVPTWTRGSKDWVECAGSGSIRVTQTLPVTLSEGSGRLPAVPLASNSSRRARASSLVRYIGNNRSVTSRTTILGSESAQRWNQESAIEQAIHSRCTAISSSSVSWEGGWLIAVYPGPSEFEFSGVARTRSVYRTSDPNSERGLSTMASTSSTVSGAIVQSDASGSSTCDGPALGVASE